MIDSFIRYDSIHSIRFDEDYLYYGSLLLPVAISYYYIYCIYRYIMAID